MGFTQIPTQKIKATCSVVLRMTVRPTLDSKGKRVCSQLSVSTVV